MVLAAVLCANDGMSSLVFNRSGVAQVLLWDYDNDWGPRIAPECQRGPA